MVKRHFEHDGRTYLDSCLLCLEIMNEQLFSQNI
jgi:hypothetical protein